MTPRPAPFLPLAALACTGALLLASGCSIAQPIGTLARADLDATRGGPVFGTVNFRVVQGMVQVSGTVRGLAPGSAHGFLIHERGDCSDNGNRIGADFNPGSGSHGRFDAAGSHAGDLPQLKADANGIATFSFDAHNITVASGAADIVGRSLVVHRDSDDTSTQPSGGTGPALACAVIMQR